MNQGLTLAIALALLSGSNARQHIRMRGNVLRYRDMIREEAIKQGVPVDLALATAKVESNFNPAAEGDLHWHKNKVRFERVVPRDNPYYEQPELWHSYGIFQLLAPYHVKPGEDPRNLLDPSVNIERGVAYLKRLLRVHHGDPNLVRLHYTGAIGADAATQARVLAIFTNALNTERRIA